MDSHGLSVNLLTPWDCIRKGLLPILPSVLVILVKSHGRQTLLGLSRGFRLKPLVGRISVSAVRTKPTPTDPAISSIKSPKLERHRGSPAGDIVDSKLIARRHSTGIRLLQFNADLGGVVDVGSRCRSRSVVVHLDEPEPRSSQCCELH